MFYIAITRDQSFINFNPKPFIFQGKLDDVQQTIWFVKENNSNILSVLKKKAKMESQETHPKFQFSPIEVLLTHLCHYINIIFNIHRILFFVFSSDV